MKIFIKEHETGGYVIARENEKRAGAMTYITAGQKVIIIDHTEVEPEYNGKGIGLQMLHKIVDMARENNLKIIPLCPFAAAMFKKFDDIKDVLKT